MGRGGCKCCRSWRGVARWLVHEKLDDRFLNDNLDLLFLKEGVSKKVQIQTTNLFFVTTQVLRWQKKRQKKREGKGKKREQEKKEKGEAGKRFKTNKEKAGQKQMENLLGRAKSGKRMRGQETATPYLELVTRNFRLGP